MRLREIEVEHWRGLSGKLGPFSDTLNLISGPNEAGKSRFFQAIRYALFESYKGTAQHKQKLQSWTSAESPTVCLSFEVDGAQYKLTKRFLKGGYAELSGAGQTLKDAEAEDKLLQLTGGREASSRGETPSDAMGVWPLLMVEQGQSRDAASHALNRDSQSRLQDLLSSEIGTAAISATGKKLLELAAAERDRFFTPSGQEKAQLKQTRTRCDAAQADLSQAEDAYNKQISTAAELSELRQKLADLTPRLERVRNEAKEAQQQAEAARDARNQRDSKQSARDLAANRKQSCEQALHARESLQSELQDAAAQLSQAQHTRDELAQNQQQLSEQLRHKEQAMNAARAQRDKAREHLKAAQKAQQAQQTSAQIGQLEAIYKALQNNAAQVHKRRDQRAKLVEISEKNLASLRDLEQQYKVAQAQLDGAAMRIGITAHQAISINGQSLPSGGQRELLVTGREQITLDGIADIDVRPQQGTLDELKTAVDTAQQALKDALDSFGVTDIAQAATAESQWSQLTRDIQALEREAKIMSSQPLPELQEELARLQAKLSELGEINEDSDLPSATDAHEVAQQAMENAESKRSAADKLLNQHLTQLAEAKAIAEQLASQQQSRQHKLDGMPTLESLQTDLSQAQQALAQAQLALDEAIQRFAALGGEQITDDAARAQRALRQLEQRQAESKSTLDELQGSLRMLVQSGRYEQVQDCAAELELATAERLRLERDALAAKRLYDVLADKQQALVDRLTAPVIERIQPYLVDIFPGSKLRHGDKLDFTGLQSDNVEEDFQALSGGAQEQLALITRIGLAEVLATDERLPLILDDSLVNSDADRIKRLHRTLDKASARLQIIVLTCHEAWFDALGADFHQTLKSGRDVSG